MNVVKQNQAKIQSIAISGAVIVVDITIVIITEVTVSLSVLLVAGAKSGISTTCTINYLGISKCKSFTFSQT